MSNRSSIDWLELDRLVDGRLDGNAYRELLCQIDADPDGWRQCAMAFLEHQALEKELSAFGSDPSCDLMACLSPMGPVSEAASDSASASDFKPELNKNQSLLTKKSPASIIGWISMALCIVGGAALGFTLNSNLDDRLTPYVPMTPALHQLQRSQSGQMILGSEAHRNGSHSADRESCVQSANGKQRCHRQRYTLQTREGQRSDPLDDCGGPFAQCEEYYGQRRR